MKICSVRVLYMDTDQMGVVNHAVALRWFEVARAEWFRQRGRTYRQLEEDGVMLPVYQLAVKYRAPSRYDDVLDLHARLDPPGAVRLTFCYRVVRAHDQALLIEGMTQHACVGPGGAPRRLPAALLGFLAEQAQAGWPDSADTAATTTTAAPRASR